jgi:hypothetical protein
VVESRRSKLDNQPIELALVRVGRTFALDQFAGDRRVARIQVPGMRPGAQVTNFLAAVWAPDQVGLDLSFVGKESARVELRTYVITDQGFERIR